MRHFVVFALVMSFCSLPSLAQQPPGQPPPPAAPERRDTKGGGSGATDDLPERGGAQSKRPESSGSGETRNWTTIEIVLSVAILIFALLVLLIQAYLVRKATAALSARSIVRMNGLTLIITAGLLLVTAGYSADQVSPVMGLLGTIAGYLLGSGEEGAKTA